MGGQKLWKKIVLLPQCLFPLLLVPHFLERISSQSVSNSSLQITLIYAYLMNNAVRATPSLCLNTNKRRCDTICRTGMVFKEQLLLLSQALQLQYRSTNYKRALFKCLTHVEQWIVKGLRLSSFVDKFSRFIGWRWEKIQYISSCLMWLSTSVLKALKKPCPYFKWFRFSNFLKEQSNHREIFVQHILLHFCIASEIIWHNIQPNYFSINIT